MKYSLSGFTLYITLTRSALQSHAFSLQNGGIGRRQRSPLGLDQATLMQPQELYGNSILYMKKDDAATATRTRSRRAFDDSTPSSKIDYRLSASSISSGNFSPTIQSNNDMGNLIDSITGSLQESKNFLPVVSAALLITSNTVGASMMVLPGLAQGPGMIVSSGLIAAVYFFNLLSGLLIAEVAINQYESSSCEVPSSFKEFADTNLQSNTAGTFVSTISMFINTCVLSYDLVAAGHLTDQAIANDAVKSFFGKDVMTTLSSTGHAGLFIVATFFVTLVSTQSGAALSGIASLCCMALFTCFAGLVLPGLATIHDPLATFAAQGTSEFGSDIFMHDISTFVPVLLTAMVYQNIVPTITKMLNYDRKNTVKAITLGSAIPVLMYIAFCFTVLGGGVVSGEGGGAMFLTGISASSVFGSAMACVLSISEEVDVYFNAENIPDCDTNGSIESVPVVNTNDVASLPSVVLAIIAPVLAGVFLAGGDGFVKALSVSGSYGSPLLYGVVPVILVFTQRTSILNEMKGNGYVENLKAVCEKIMQNDTNMEKQIVPGGMASIGVLGAGATALMSSHLVEDLSSIDISSVL